MFLIRSAARRDAPAVLALARHLNSYNLPADPGAVRALLADSERSFRGARIPDEKRRYLFVAEEIPSGKVVGSSLIIARHGTPKLPHLSFRLADESKRSATLGKTVKHRTLRLEASHRGFTEIGGLALLPSHRGHAEKIGKQLSYARFAFMARRRAAFCPRVLVEYLPVLEPGKGNALWDALGAVFTELSYAKADRLSAENKEFILSLFPREKIYAGLLPLKARKHLGVPGRGAQASLALLERIGFRFLGQIDPFDGGPHYGAELKKIPLVRRTARGRYAGSAMPGENAPQRLVMTQKNGVLRACVARIASKRGGIYLPKDEARALRLAPGDAVTLTPF